MEDLPTDLATCDREWLCRTFLPGVSCGGTVGLKLFLRLMRETTATLGLDVSAPSSPVASGSEAAAVAEQGSTEGGGEQHHHGALVRLDDPRVPCLIIGPMRGHTDVARTLALAAAKNPLLSVVFLGDYIDGGLHSVEALCLAMATRLALGPHRVAILRGRHEHLFPVPPKFTGSVEARLDQDVRWRCVRFVAQQRMAEGLPLSCDEATERERALMSEVEYELRSLFLAMPLAATVHGQLFCCSGGPSTGAPTVEDVAGLDRGAEFGSPGCAAVNDLTCSEVADEDEDALLTKDGSTHARNIEFGVGAVYSYAAVCDFLKHNELHTVVRGSLMPLHADPPFVSIAYRHSTGKFSPNDPGFRIGKATPIGSPSTITLFSAPRLAGRAANTGAVLWVTDGLATVQQFEADPRRGVQLPRDHKRSAFDWSLPMLTTHLRAALSWMATPDDGESDEEQTPEQRSEAQIAQAKVARFRRLCRHTKRTGGSLASLSSRRREEEEEEEEEQDDFAAEERASAENDAENAAAAA